MDAFEIEGEFLLAVFVVLFMRSVEYSSARPSKVPGRADFDCLLTAASDVVWQHAVYKAEFYVGFGVVEVSLEMVVDCENGAVGDWHCRNIMINRELT